MKMVGYIRFAALALIGSFRISVFDQKRKKSPEESNGRRFKSI